jgi:hypothetical protein
MVNELREAGLRDRGQRYAVVGGASRTTDALTGKPDCREVGPLPRPGAVLRVRHAGYLCGECAATAFLSTPATLSHCD